MNFQFCGALVNYDMPWNPMRVEQRIGCIDRLGQEHPVTAEELEEPERPSPLYTLGDLGALLARPALLPPGTESTPLGSRDWAWSAPGLPAPVRITTDPDYYEQHPDSTEPWSPGSPVFPIPDMVAGPEGLAGLDWHNLIADIGQVR